MSDRVAVGVSFASTVPVSGLVESYRSAEQCGFDELWVHEDYFYHGGFAAAAMALTATTRIAVGIGIVSAMVRHPAVTAMEIATIAGAHPGRLRVGIGHGAPDWMRQMKLQQKSPLGTLREVLTSVERLLQGETLTQSGIFHFDGVRLAYPNPDVPLYTGVIGPKSLALSGEIADGTVITVMAGPKYVERARQITSEAAARVPRRHPHLLPTLSYCFVDRDGAAGRRAARAAIGQMLAAAGPDLLTNVYGIDDQIRDMIARGGAAVLEKEMPEEWIDWFAAAGEPDQCVEKIRALGHAGSSSVVLALTDPATVRSSLDLLAAAVLPKLRS
jgi:alkanesulfonate monooxygenase SsuD/methylene tetrahydromethanopterin reductase-like flavin-dependent oxidoreductase (luciferase family)